jgi:hypothetical protein
MWRRRLISAIGIIPVWIGLKLGGNIRRRLSPDCSANW